MERRLYLRYLALFLAAAAFVLVGPSGAANAQQNQNNPPPRAYDRDITTWEVASFFDFLNGQPKSTREELDNNPKLLTNQEYLQSHPDLQTYLQQHPTVREEANENPNAFMTQEKRYASFAFRSDADDYHAPGDRRRSDDNRGDVDRNQGAQDLDRRDRDADAGRNTDRDRDDRARFGNRGELARFDQFLDSHREIAEQLRHNPSLASNQQFVQNHPALQTFLQNNPGVREQLTQNPNTFMQRENRYDMREEAGAVDRDRMGNRGVLATFDRFLDSHPDIAKDLRKNPPQADNEQYVKAHPALQAFYQEHPEVRHEISLHENNFMQQENRYDAREAARNRDDNPDRGDNDRRDRDFNAGVRDRDDAVRDRDDAVRDRDDARRENNNPQGVRDRDTTRGELASFDRFLDSHRETAEQLRRNPSLINNQQFVQNHPALQTYLQQNPQVREEIAENPNTFMRQENQFDHREAMDHGRAMQAANFREFLGGHATMSQELSHDPSKANDPLYQRNHPELQTYLKAHPDVQTALNQNPQSFMKSVQQPTTGTTTGTGATGSGSGTTTGSPKPPTGTTGAATSATGTTGTTSSTKPTPQPPKQ